LIKVIMTRATEKFVCLVIVPAEWHSLNVLGQRIGHSTQRDRIAAEMLPQGGFPDTRFGTDAWRQRHALASMKLSRTPLELVAKPFEINPRRSSRERALQGKSLFEAVEQSGERNIQKVENDFCCGRPEVKPAQVDSDLSQRAAPETVQPKQITFRDQVRDV